MEGWWLRLKEWWVYVKEQWPYVIQDPMFLWALIAIGALLVVWLLVRLFRGRSATPTPERTESLSADDSRHKRKAGKSIQKTLEELRSDDPQFVELMDSILKYRTIDQLLNHDEVEVAFGRLSYLQEKRKAPPKKRSSLLALDEDPQDAKEKRAAMLTVIRSCYASDEIYSALDEKGRRLVDQFLDSLGSEIPTGSN
jgi:hypothetical protein